MVIYLKTISWYLTKPRKSRWSLVGSPRDTSLFRLLSFLLHCAPPPIPNWSYAWFLLLSVAFHLSPIPECFDTNLPWDHPGGDVWHSSGGWLVLQTRQLASGGDKHEVNYLQHVWKIVLGYSIWIRKNADGQFNIWKMSTYIQESINRSKW